MNKRDLLKARQLTEALQVYSRDVRPLQGISEVAPRKVFVQQLVESIHRVAYVPAILGRDISSRRADPNDEIFDPIRASIYHQREGRTDEAFWCVFLFVHFGKHSKGSYRYARDVYGRLGDGSLWDWEAVSTNPKGFRTWLAEKESAVRQSHLPGGFGSHRKYQSLSATSTVGTGAAVESYVQWVWPPRTHEELFAEAVAASAGDPKVAFDQLYRSMNDVTSFGRTARFDYLTMVGKLGLAAIEPGSTFMTGSTGPYTGARLLFGRKETENVSRPKLDSWLADLDDALGVGMQAMEDALCNWQKSPSRFIAFRG